MNSQTPGGPDRGSLSWSFDELADYHGGVMDPEREANFSIRIAADPEAQAALRALDRVDAQLSRLGERDARDASNEIPPRPIDFVSSFANSQSFVAVLPQAPADHSPSRPADLPDGRWRSRRTALITAVAAAAAAVLAVVITLAVGDSTGPAPSIAAPRPGQAQKVAVPTGRPDLLRLDLRISGVRSASVYFGRLDAVAATLREKGPDAIDPDTLAAAPAMCAETVVIEGVPGTRGAVYAVDLIGWGAAEGAPPILLTEPDRTIHQQIITPPSGLVAPTSLTGAVRVQSDAIDEQSAPFQVILRSQDVNQQTWSLDGDNTAMCTIAPS